MEWLFWATVLWFSFCVNKYVTNVYCLFMLHFKALPLELGTMLGLCMLDFIVLGLHYL